MADFENIFTRRMFMLLGLKATLISTLIGRLYYLQILKGSHYKVLSDKNHLHSGLLEPSRGFIFDRHGMVLAGHKISYKVHLSAEAARNPKDILSLFQKLIPLSTMERDLIQTRLKKRRKGALILIKEDLSWDELSCLEIHKEELKGLIIDKGEKRFYPLPLQTCHIIGYVGAVSEKELNNPDFNDPLLTIPGFRVGKTGVEKIYNATLQGEAGIQQVAIDAYGRIKQTFDTIPATKGEDLHLTIDFNLQKRVQDILSPHKSAAAVVMDVHDGSILALVSHPSYNTQLFIDTISKQVWNDVSLNPYKPLLNKVTQGLYPPGSLFKMIVALAALENGTITKNTTIFCPGHYDVSGQRFHCWNWKQGGHGHMNVQHAIAESCDVFFYQVAQKMGIDRIADMAKQFGYGTVTGIDLPGEYKGLVPTRAWKKEKRRETWTIGDTLNASIGQGFLMATPLQHAKMVAMLVNGQRPIRPHVVQNSDRHKTLTHPSTPNSIPTEHLTLILDGMRDVVNAPFGTAYGSRLLDPCCSMAGKTGSAQVSRITKQQRAAGTHNDREYEHKEHAMFAAFAPAENPRYAISVIVEHGGGGAKVAAPLARDIALAVQMMDKKETPS